MSTAAVARFTQERLQVYGNNNNNGAEDGAGARGVGARKKSGFFEADSVKDSSVGENFVADPRMVIDIWANPRHPRFSMSSRDKKRLYEPASSHGIFASTPVEKQAAATALNSSFDDSVFYSATYEEALETTRGLCRDYICYRLKRSGFGGRVVITKYEPAKDQNMSFDVLKIGKTFEFCYPHLFRNLARQLGYVLKSEHELRTLFNRLGSNIIGVNPEEYTWARVLALLGVAGALSVDCMAQGHCELVEDMVTIFCDFVESNLLTWIMEHDGWVGMTNTFNEMNRTDRNKDLVSCSFTKILGLFFLTSTLVSAGVLGFGVLAKYNISYVLSHILP